MPSLNPKRQVRYTESDLNAIRGVRVMLEFMRDYDTEFVLLDAALEHLEAVDAHIEKTRTKATKKPAAQ